ncbi:MAG TPA: hypothetical protein VN132_09895, partial [Bdellovibrio sp.]|nr:hypothetical protein [Bdellovibrio sp.]
YAFVLMSNHYHMIASCSAEHNLGEVMAWLQRSISKAINARTHRINHIFGGPYKACLIRHPAHFASVFKYVLRNPLQAEIVDDVKKYPFSTFTRKSVEVCRRDEWSVDIPEETDDLCKWLNTDFPNSSYKTIQAELKQTIFNPRDRDSREILFP